MSNAERLLRRLEEVANIIGKDRLPDPIPYTHNSGWIQSPGPAVTEDPRQWPRLERYVKELLARFKDDPRIALWDLYNEPSNGVIGDPDTGGKPESIGAAC